MLIIHVISSLGTSLSWALPLGLCYHGLISQALDNILYNRMQCVHVSGANELPCNQAAQASW